MKRLSKAVTATFKLMYKHIENYNYKIQYYSDVKTLWPVKSNQSVIDKINKLNSRNIVISAAILIPPLYIQLSHIKNWNQWWGELVNFCFSCRDKELFAIWTNKQQKYRLFVNKTSLKLAANYLLDNCYFN